MDGPPQVEVTAFSHRGRVRESNEDSMTVAGWVSDVAMSEPRRSRHALTGPILCAVADGMGGHAAGEIASCYAIKRLAAETFTGIQPNMARAVLAAINAELYRTMGTDRSLAGMGTTVAGLLLSTVGVLWFNVGDSRVYSYRDGSLQRLSLDHVPAGARSGIITQSLGGSLAFLPVDPHIGVDELAIPSRWLICSDGLSDMVSDAEIGHCLAHDDDEAAARTLFEMAMVAGGEDNVSIVLASVGR
jgi:serine/threonine protein phosphatase PrpC